MNKLFVGGWLLTSLLLLGCNEQTDQKTTLSEPANNKVQTAPQNNNNQPKNVKPLSMQTKQMWQTGTVQLFNLEGGFYGIVTTTGAHILPMNLPKEFRAPGTKLRFIGEKMDVKTIQQWGVPTKLIKTELIEKGDPDQGKNYL